MSQPSHDSFEQFSQQQSTEQVQAIGNIALQADGAVPLAELVGNDAIPNHVALTLSGFVGGHVQEHAVSTSVAVGFGERLISLHAAQDGHPTDTVVYNAVRLRLMGATKQQAAGALHISMKELNTHVVGFGIRVKEIAGGDPTLLRRMLDELIEGRVSVPPANQDCIAAHSVLKEYLATRKETKKEKRVVEVAKPVIPEVLGNGPDEEILPLDTSLTALFKYSQVPQQHQRFVTEHITGDLPISEVKKLTSSLDMLYRAARYARTRTIAEEKAPYVRDMPKVTQADFRLALDLFGNSTDGVPAYPFDAIVRQRLALKPGLTAEQAEAFRRAFAVRVQTMLSRIIQNIVYVSRPNNLFDI